MINKAGSIDTVAGIIENEFGLYFPQNRYENLKRALSGVAGLIYGTEDSSLIIKDILHNGSIPENISEPLISSLTITETYFFREAPSISLFVNKIIPEIKERDGEYRIWSAGCSSGEEPYTLAMLLRENLNSTQLEKVKILATDVNHNALEKAANGIYTDWSFRETPGILKEKYFKHSHGKWIIESKIKKMVEFATLNLARDFSNEKIGYKGFDLIFCRNVLMYFSPVVIKNITTKFSGLLPENGWLVVSQVELNDDYFGNYSKFNYENGIFYKKSSQVRTIHQSKIGRVKSVSKEIAPPSVKHIKRLKKLPEEKTNSVADNSVIKYQDLELLYYKGNYEECIKRCLTYSGTEVKKNSVSLLLAKCYANRGEYPESVETIDKIILSGGSGEDIYYLYGTVLKELKETKRAIEAFKKVLYLNPDHLFSNLLLGNILSEEGNMEKAARYYKNVLEILSNIDDSHIIPDSGGLTKRRLTDMVENLIEKQRR